jgi:hypothetical protein
LPEKRLLARLQNSLVQAQTGAEAHRTPQERQAEDKYDYCARISFFAPY